MAFVRKPLIIFHHEAKMLARKGIFAKPSIYQSGTMFRKSDSFWLSSESL
ncbi:MAG: hypothetical protein IJH37_04850 [Clostridia bacterium]|nr:hypothetical protein [Clostridia bacterium]